MHPPPASRVVEKNTVVRSTSSSDQPRGQCRETLSRCLTATLALAFALVLLLVALAVATVVRGGAPGAGAARGGVSTFGVTSRPRASGNTEEEQVSSLEAWDLP